MEAAKMFGLEAIAALDRINYLNTQSNSAYSMEEMQRDLIALQLQTITDPGQITPGLLNTLARGVEAAPIPPNPMTLQIEALQQQYVAFSTTFNALYQGNYFAANAVKKTQAHAIRLTLQLIELAELIEKTPYQFTGERSDLLLKIYDIKTDTTTTDHDKSKTMQSIAGEILQLAKQEKDAKGEAVRQCLKAAERGRLVADLARNYKRMSLGEMLNSVEGPMSYTLQFLGEQPVGHVMHEYINIRATIQEDPYWSALISMENE